MNASSNTGATEPAALDRIAWLEANLATCLRMAEDAERDPENFVAALSMRSAAKKWAVQLDDARVEAGELPPRPMTSFLDSLSSEQKEKLMSYDGPESHGAADPFLSDALTFGPATQTHAGDGGGARGRRETELVRLRSQIALEDAASAESERGRLDFEARYAAATDAARLRWLEGEGDDGGSLWWARAHTELTCLRKGEDAEAFVARTIAMRGLNAEAGR